jgi:hypothetical protein
MVSEEALAAHTATETYEDQMEQSSKRGREEDDEDALREETTCESILRPQQVPSVPFPTATRATRVSVTPTITKTVTPPDGHNAHTELPTTSAYMTSL